jgi:ABC-type Fe3+ transport system substrate-binding protein
MSNNPRSRPALTVSPHAASDVPDEQYEQLEVVFDDDEAPRAPRPSMAAQQPTVPQPDYDLESVLEEIDAMDLEPDDGFLFGDDDSDNKAAADTARHVAGGTLTSSQKKPQTASTPASSVKQPAATKRAAAAAPTATGQKPAAKATGQKPAAKATGQKPAAKAASDTSGRAADPTRPVTEAAPTDAAATASPEVLGYEVLPDDGAPAVAAGAPSCEGLPVETPTTKSLTGRLRRRWKVGVGLAVAGVLAGICFLAYDRALRADSSLSPSDNTAYESIRRRAAARRPAAEDVPPAGQRSETSQETESRSVAATIPSGPSPAVSDKIEIGVAYGTEKRNWLEWAAREFAASPAGSRIRVNLIPMGSLESAHAILDGDQRIHVWSPASSLYRETLLRDWEAKHGGQPILKEEALALTPMVLVMWKTRYEAYSRKCPEVSLRTFSYAMHAAQGWATIAAKPEWGRFKFGHTHPNQSNSGLMTLLVLAYEYADRSAGLTVTDIMTAEFQEHLTRFGTGVAGLSNSTGNMMKEMTLKGPTSYDALMVYESVAIDYLESAKGRWGPLQVVYPKHNLWNDNPYCILSTKWTTAEHQQAAETFLKFLMSPPAQQRALDHGFRPGNPAVPVNGDQSPFVRFADCGLRVEIPEVCEVPSWDVVQNLQQAWIRHAMPLSQGRR